jgi:hypothetical protein
MISTVIIFAIPAFKTFHLQLVGTFIIHLHKIQHIHNYHVSSVIPVKLKTGPKLDTATILLYSEEPKQTQHFSFFQISICIVSGQKVSLLYIRKTVCLFER